MNDYFNNRNLFYYEYTHNRNILASNECFDEEKQKFMINCNTFVENIIMGRSINDYLGKNKENYSSNITKVFDFGYYPEFLMRKKYIK